MDRANGSSDAEGEDAPPTVGKVADAAAALADAVAAAVAVARAQSSADPKVQSMSGVFLR